MLLCSHILDNGKSVSESDVRQTPRFEPYKVIMIDFNNVAWQGMASI